MSSVNEKMEFVFFKSGNKVQFLGLGDKEQFMPPYSPCNNSIFSLRDEKGWNFLHDEIWISHVRLLANVAYPNSPQNVGRMMEKVRKLRRDGKDATSIVSPFRAYIGLYAESIYRAAYHLMTYMEWEDFCNWPPLVQTTYLKSHTKVL